jgi:hypothetical protein
LYGNALYAVGLALVVCMLKASKHLSALLPRHPTGKASAAQAPDSAALHAMVEVYKAGLGVLYSKEMLDRMVAAIMSSANVQQAVAVMGGHGEQAATSSSSRSSTLHVHMTAACCLADRAGADVSWS